MGGIFRLIVIRAIASLQISNRGAISHAHAEKRPQWSGVTLSCIRSDSHRTWMLRAISERRFAACEVSPMPRFAERVTSVLSIKRGSMATQQFHIRQLIKRLWATLISIVRNDIVVATKPKSAVTIYIDQRSGFHLHSS